MGTGLTSTRRTGQRSLSPEYDFLAEWILPYPFMPDPCGAVMSADGAVTRRILRDMCQRRHTASHSLFQDQSRPRDGRGGSGDVCAGGVRGRVGCKAFDQMAGELKA